MTIKSDQHSKIENFIDAMTSFEEVSAEMKKIGENYIRSKQIEARLLADWMYRFGAKIEELEKKNRRNPACESAKKFVRTLERASAKTKESQMKFK